MRLCDLAPAHIRAISPYQPGKPISELAREMGLEESSIVKLASNENPLGVGDKTRVAMQAALADIARYPDGSEVRIVSGAGVASVYDGRPIALVGSALDNGDHITGPVHNGMVIVQYADEAPIQVDGGQQHG